MMDADRDSKPSVLLDFRAANVRSFRDPVAFSLRSGTMSDPDVVRTVELNAAGHTVGVVPAAAVYGPNGSGKSNLLRAMHDMRGHVLHSFRGAAGPIGGVQRKPFLLDDEAAVQVSTFEIDLVLQGVRVEYGFTVDDGRYVTERAHHYPRGRRSLLFERDGDTITLGGQTKSKGRAIVDILRPNALFLSTAAFAGHPALGEIYRWFSRNLILAAARTRANRQGYTTDMIFQDHRRDSVLALLRLVDPGIIGVVRQQMDPVMHERIRRAVRIVLGEEDESEAPDDIPTPELGVRFAHQGAHRHRVEFDRDDESLGTLVWFGVVGPVIDALADGCVFLADELDASLHPELSRQLVRIFQDHRTNPRRAQLVFNSHDTSLLGDTERQVLGRDQVWLVDKSSDGNSSLHQLSEYSPRKDSALGRRYLAGHFGGLPATTDEQFDDAVLDALAHRGSAMPDAE